MHANQCLHVLMSKDSNKQRHLLWKAVNKAEGTFPHFPMQCRAGTLSFEVNSQESIQSDGVRLSRGQLRLLGTTYLLPLFPGAVS